MKVFSTFQKRMLLNYMIGSLTAVFGVGSVFIFHTLTLNSAEIRYLLGIMLISGMTMLTGELLLYRFHIRPLRTYFTSKNHTIETIETAFITAHRFPILTVQRILGPHLLGLSIPASLLTYLAINHGLVDIPIHYILYAWSGATLIAILHALIEFYLTAQATEPLIEHIATGSTRPLSLDGQYFLSIRTKLLMSSLTIAVFPVTLFMLATQIRTSESGTGTYWSWASLVIIVILVVAIGCAMLLYRSIERPIQALREKLDKVHQGEFHHLGNVYHDEFANLVSGYNTMVTGIKNRDHENEQLLDSFFSVFAATLDARDSYTAGHTNRVADYATEIANRASFSADQLDLLRKSSLLHDIGKIGVRDEVLLKEGKLSDDEFAQIKRHPLIGASILEQVGLPEHLRPILSGVKYHHERYDGKGYPEGLAGEDIPLFGRVIAVADAFDAMTSDRPYRKGMPVTKALSIIEKGKGTQWDPYYADVFIKIQQDKLKTTGNRVE